MNSQLRVLLVHPVVLPATHYGGAERVTLWLARALTQFGHRVTIACRARSRLPEAIGHLPMEPGDAEWLRLVAALPGGATGPQYDVLHSMTPIPAIAQRELTLPWLWTLHGNAGAGEVLPPQTVYLSRDHATRHGASAFVYNGLDPDEYRLGERSLRECPLVFLSKTHLKTKNLRGALAIAAAAGVSIRVAGGERPWGLRVGIALSSRLRPLVSWEGSVDQSRKRELLAQGRALLFPIRWHEPFGLVAVESLLSGMPVLATRLGSLSELIEGAPTPVGKLIDPTDCPDDLSAPARQLAPWVEAIEGCLAEVSRKACRDYAAERFGMRAMARAYVHYYEHVIGGRSSLTSAPK